MPWDIELCSLPTSHAVPTETLTLASPCAGAVARLHWHFLIISLNPLLDVGCDIIRHRLREVVLQAVACQAGHLGTEGLNAFWFCPTDKTSSVSTLIGEELRQEARQAAQQAGRKMAMLYCCRGGTQC